MKLNATPLTLILFFYPLVQSAHEIAALAWPTQQDHTPPFQHALNLGFHAAWTILVGAYVLTRKPLTPSSAFTGGDIFDIFANSLWAFLSAVVVGIALWALDLAFTGPGPAEPQDYIDFAFLLPLGLIGLVHFSRLAWRQNRERKHKKSL